MNVGKVEKVVKLGIFKASQQVNKTRLNKSIMTFNQVVPWIQEV